MADSFKTFSESWYRVANQRISLRPDVKVRRQNYRGERWIILENPFSNQYFRLRPEAYEFIARLRPDRTVQEIWQQCLDRFHDRAPSQEAVIHLLSQLYFHNLLQYDLATDSAQLFERYKKRRQREIASNFLNIMFMRFPLLDPDRFLVRTLPVVGKLISPVGAVLWMLVVGFALKIALDNFESLLQKGQGILAPSNLPLFYLGLVIIKTSHEFGHAYFCRRFGGEVHVMGIQLMIFTPIPYVDATSSWSFRSRWKRVLVGAAGMIVEVFFAAIATFVWARTSEGTLHNLAYNIMIIASVSTVIFNINPLLRFDGYYILSDLLEIPNLSQRASSQLRHLAERYLLGVKKSQGPAESRREAGWLAFFGSTSGIYRVIVFGGMLLTVADHYLIIGMVMAVYCLISWFTFPIIAFVRYLATDPRLDRVRARAIGVTAGIACLLVVLLGVVPFPYAFRAPGVLRAIERTEVLTETAGNVEEVFVKPGTPVKRGQPLLKLQNRELELQLAAAQAHYDEISTRLRQATAQESADIAPLTQLQDSAADRLKKFAEDSARLVVRARHDGVWVAPGIENFVGRWLPRGSDLGLLINPASFEFVATVMQEDVNGLFGQKTPPAEVRLYGQSAIPLPVTRWRMIPGEQNTLPSAALGGRAGGEVAVAADDTQGNKAAEPFFEVLGKLEPKADVALLDGRSGQIRFKLQPEPLLTRWFRSLWQLLQKRYQL